MRFSLACFAALAIGSAAPAPAQMTIKTVASQNWWPQTLTPILARAAKNRPQVLAALRNVPNSQRNDLLFLLQNMPTSDLQTLRARFLLDHLALIGRGFALAPWKNAVPRAIFLNDILPYASLNEARDNSFEMLQDKARALVANAKTPGEAAQILNKELFPLVKVRYSTQRQRADQSPLQSIGSGLASCSGLSILLVDACRSVGVPARVVGTPMWANGRGNHTWVEIWDNGWQFMGAAEPDEQGLNHGWFVGDAAQARRDVPENAIYATSFAPTTTHFPLVWAPENTTVNAVNVTERYAKTSAPKTTTRVLLQVLAEDGKRVAEKIVLKKSGSDDMVFQGVSKDESADTNDFLSVELPRGERYVLTVGSGEKQYQKEFAVEAKSEQLLRLGTSSTPPLWTMQPTYTPPVAAPIEAKLAAQVANEIGKFFAAAPQEQATWQFSPSAEKLLRENEAGAREIAWQAFKSAPIHNTQRADYDKNQVTFEKYLSPYVVREVGTKPPNGWGLVIAMHGGGGTAKEVNDSQWAGMQTHYRDHPEVGGGYKYLALRAPNDTWNGFYDDYVYPLVGNLIEQFTIFGDVNPNKVFLTGYSHGGYGAFAIGPKMPDYFAAIHASAGAGTDGETAPINLRNTVFTALVGERDTMYDRLSRNQRFDKEIRELRGNRSDIFPVRADVALGFEHGNLQDRDILSEIMHATRNPVPRELTWLMTDTVIHDFFWLHTDAPAKTKTISATCRDNQLTVQCSDAASTVIDVDSRLIDFAKPVQMSINGVKSQRTLTPSLRVLCATLQQRGDAELAFSAQIRADGK